MPIDREAFESMDSGERKPGDKILDFLRENPGQAFRAEEISENLRMSHDTVKSTLHILTGGVEPYDFDGTLLNVLSVFVKERAKNIDIPIDWSVDGEGRVWYIYKSE